jgi:hypothetical protein
VSSANGSGSSQLQGEVAQLKQLMEAAAEAAHQQLQQQQQSYDQQVGVPVVVLSVNTPYVASSFFC